MHLGGQWVYEFRKRFSLGGPTGSLGWGGNKISGGWVMKNLMGGR